jgi:hypothetical protein
MMRRPPSLDADPARWLGRASGELEEDRAAERLRGALELPPPTIPVGFLGVTRSRRRRLLLLPVVRLATVLSLAMGVGAAAASGAWLVHSLTKGEPRENRLEVSAGGVARLHKVGRWRLALGGPGAVTVLDGDAGGVRLASGTLTVAAESGAVAVEIHGEQFRVDSGSVARVGLAATGGVEAVAVAGTVEALTSRSATRPASEAERAAAWRTLDSTLATGPDGLVVSPVAPPSFAPPSAVAPAIVRAPARARATVAATTWQAPALADAPALVGEPAPAPNDLRAPSELVPPAASTPALAGESESALLSRALVKLRRDVEPDAALTLLDDYAARFPGGVLLPEVTAVRIEALLARNDGATALETLDGLPTPQIPLERAMRVLRGELRAKAARCLDATRDFTRVLQTPPSDAIDERALRGRAACAALTHDDDQLRADLDTYVARFPDRPFASEARLRRQAERSSP